MSDSATFQLTTELIHHDFALPETGAEVSQDDLLRLLADHIDYLLQHRMEWLLSLLYRLDVSEAKVNAALPPAAPEPANVGLARLIFERQLQRAFTKLHVRTEPLEDDLAW